MTDIKQEPRATEPTGGNQEPQATEPTGGNQEQKSFTQDEVNEIVEKRLRGERKKYEDYEALKKKAEKFDELEEASMSELEKMTKRAEAAEAELARKEQEDQVREIRERVAAEMSVPANLLSGATEEECKKQAQGILDFAKPAGYPQVRTAPAQVPAGNRSPRDAFAEYMTEVMGKRG
jgi:hypothetical protein